jgi:hypothetical protein
VNVPRVQQVITEMERCQAFNPLSPGSWTRWIGMLQQAGEGAQTVITGDEGKPMSMMELISDAPCEPEPYIDYLIAHYTGYREATWPESKRGALVEADCVMIQIDHFLIQLDDIKRKMHRPLAASSARAGSERQDALDLSALKAVRDELWNKSRSPQGRDEQARYDMAHRINDEINRLGRLASVPAVAAPSVGDDEAEWFRKGYEAGVRGAALDAPEPPQPHFQVGDFDVTKRRYRCACGGFWNLNFNRPAVHQEPVDG